MGILAIEGYASVVGVLDNNRRIFSPGWASGFLSANPDLVVPLLWYHNEGPPGAGYIPIGAAGEFAEDEIGMSYKGEIADTSDGRDAAEIMKTFGELGTSFHFLKGTGGYDQEFNLLVETAEFDEVSIMSPGRQANILATSGIAGEFTSPAIQYMETIKAVRQALELATAA